MRRLQKGRGRKKPRKKAEPLTEGIIVPLDSRGRRGWKSMSDEKLVKYSGEVIKRGGINNKIGLLKEDRGLYRILRRRKLLGRLGFKKKKTRKARDWASVSDEELVEYAQRFLEENGIKNRCGLYKEDVGLYAVLNKRKLLERLEFEERLRNWASMSDEELVAYAKKEIEDKEMETRSKFQKEDSGLYQTLRARKLLDRAGLKQLHRDWASMSDEELVRHARRFIEEEGIMNKSGLQKEDIGLDCVLRKRRLLGRLKFEKEKTKETDWASMSDEELVAYAKKVIEEKGIKSRKGLKTKDNPLYQALRRRELIDKLNFENVKRPSGFFKKMSDEELVEYAKKVMKKKKIKSRWGLKKKDVGLYEILRRRKILDLVFEDLEQAKEKQAVQDVVDAMEEFDSS